MGNEKQGTKNMNLCISKNVKFGISVFVACVFGSSCSTSDKNPVNTSTSKTSQTTAIVSRSVVLDSSIKIENILIKLDLQNHLSEVISVSPTKIKSQLDFTSEDPTIAQSSSSGIVTAGKVGTTSILVSMNGVTLATIPVVVSNNSSANVSGEICRVAINVGASAIKGTASPFAVNLYDCNDQQIPIATYSTCVFPATKATFTGKVINWIDTGVANVTVVDSGGDTISQRGVVISLPHSYIAECKDTTWHLQYENFVFGGSGNLWTRYYSSPGVRGIVPVISLAVDSCGLPAWGKSVLTTADSIQIDAPDIISYQNGAIVSLNAGFGTFRAHYSWKNIHGWTGIAPVSVYPNRSGSWLAVTTPDSLCSVVDKNNKCVPQVGPLPQDSTCFEINTWNMAGRTNEGRHFTVLGGMDISEYELGYGKGSYRRRGSNGYISKGIGSIISDRSSGEAWGISGDYWGKGLGYSPIQKTDIPINTSIYGSNLFAIYGEKSNSEMIAPTANTLRTFTKMSVSGLCGSVDSGIKNDSIHTGIGKVGLVGSWQTEIDTAYLGVTGRGQLDTTVYSFDFNSDGTAKFRKISGGVSWDDNDSLWSKDTIVYRTNWKTTWIYTSSLDSTLILNVTSVEKSVGHIKAALHSAYSATHGTNIYYCHNTMSRTDKSSVEFSYDCLDSTTFSAYTAYPRFFLGDTLAMYGDQVFEGTRIFKKIGP